MIRAQCCRAILGVVKMPENKPKIGRPPIYRKSFAKRAQVLLGRGYPKRTLVAEFRVNESTIYQWIKDHDEFSKAVEIGIAIGERYYLEKCQALINGSKGNFQPLNLILKSIYNWSETEKETEARPIQIEFIKKSKGDR